MFPLPLIVEIQPSRQLRLGAALLHMVAGLALWLADMTSVAKAAIVAALLISLVYCLYPRGIIIIRGMKDGKLEILDGRVWNPVSRFEVEMIQPSIALLRLHIISGPRSISTIASADSLCRESFRRLRVWLKIIICS